MKANIHPIYYKNATISCACGNVVYVGATKESMTVEICSACHPFYTGKEKFIDTAGRIEKFKARVEKAHAIKQKPKKMSTPSLARPATKKRSRKTI